MKDEQQLIADVNQFRRLYGKKYTSDTPEPELKKALLEYYENKEVDDMVNPEDLA